MQIGAKAAVMEILKDHRLEMEDLKIYSPLFEARYKSITQLIIKSGVSQVLEIACGYSTRALDMTRSASIRYVETDLPGVVSTKRRLLRVIHRCHGLTASPQNLLVAADATNYDELRASVAHLEPQGPLAILCEGLLMYLSKQQIEEVAQNVRRLLQEFSGGCWITPDFTFAGEANDLPPERVRMREAISGVTQRQINGSAFEGADALAAFLGEAGFKVEVRNQVDETPSFSSIQALGLPSTIMERLRSSMRVWVMTP